MTCLVERSLTHALSDPEYELLDTMRLIVCKSKILEDQIEKVDTLVVDDSKNFGINSYDQIGD